MSKWLQKVVDAEHIPWEINWEEERLPYQTLSFSDKCFLQNQDRIIWDYQVGTI